MVNKVEIRKLLKAHFNIHGTVKITPDGVVDVDGDVEVRHVPDSGQLSVQFGKVTRSFTFWINGITMPNFTGCPAWVGGSFECSNVRILSLKGAPEYVGDQFELRFCELRTLEHGPQHVGSDYLVRRNPLQSLEHLATHIGGEVDFEYNPHMGLLRTLVAAKIAPLQGSNLLVPVADILNKYAAQGKKGALACAAELIRAGYKENARW